MTQTYICRECGQSGDAYGFDPAMREDLIRWQLCFLCGLWAEKHAWAQNGDLTPRGEPVVRINGNHYIFSGEGETGNFRGHGGREMTALMHDGRVLTSRNVWHQGDIPERWRERLPDNAVWKPYEAVDSPLAAALAELRRPKG
jgi:hypothetical protein